jgi:hypothetical protein
MKRLLPFLLLLAASPVQAGGITHKITTSVSATSDGAYSIANRVGSTYSMSSNNITASTLGGVTAPASATAAGTFKTNSYAQTTAGASTSFSESFISGDAVAAIGSGSGVSSGVVANLPAFGSVTTYSGASGNPTAALTSVGAITLGVTGPGQSVVGSISSELNFN